MVEYNEENVVDLYDPERHVRVCAFPEECPDDPRDIGAEYDEYFIEIFNERENPYKAHLKRVPDNPSEYDTFPLYKLEHGMIALSLNPYNDPWDSCLWGKVYVNKKVFTDTEKTAKRCVSEYEAYLNGNVYNIEGYVNDNDDEDYSLAYGIDDAEVICKEMFDRLCKKVPVQGKLI